jgi:hypothetical protein
MTASNPPTQATPMPVTVSGLGALLTALAVASRNQQPPGLNNSAAPDPLDDNGNPLTPQLSSQDGSVMITLTVRSQGNFNGLSTGLIPNSDGSDGKYSADTWVGACQQVVQACAFAQADPQYIASGQANCNIGLPNGTNLQLVLAGM